jgi:site-specific recombinase XerD
MINEIETYLTTLELGNLSEQTIRSYRKDLQKLSDHFSITSWGDIEVLTVADFHNFYGKEAKKIKASSLNGLIRNLSAFFNWMKENETLKSQEFFKVKFGKNQYVKVAKVKKMILDAEETERLIKAGANIQEKFMLCLMAFTAIRRQEVCNIKMTDISGCKITIRGKGNKERSIFLDDVLCSMLSMYNAQRDSDSEYLFYSERGLVGDDGKLSTTSVYNRVKSAGERAGIDPEKLEKLTPHRLRGGALTRLIITFGLNVAQRVAGHASSKTTEIYDSSDDEIVQKALLGYRKAVETRNAEA